MVYTLYIKDPTDHLEAYPTVLSLGRLAMEFESSCGDLPGDCTSDFERTNRGCSRNPWFLPPPYRIEEIVMLGHDSIAWCG
jgi:hypothetical protein